MAVTNPNMTIYILSILIGINNNIKLYTYVEKISDIDCITQLCFQLNYRLCRDDLDSMYSSWVLLLDRISLLIS